MVKIGPVEDVNFEFNQFLVPMTLKERNRIVGTCLRNRYPFSVQIPKEPLEFKSAISGTVFKADFGVIYIFHEHIEEILKTVDKLSEVE